MYFLTALLCLILGACSVVLGRRVRVTGPNDEMRGLTRAGLIVVGGFLVAAALVFLFLGVMPAE